MRLYEFESKQLLARSGIRVPRSQLITSTSSTPPSEDLLPGIVKVQTLSGKRAFRGGVQPVDDVDAVRDFAQRFLKQGFGDEPVDRILLEERIDFTAEYFLGITYDNRARKPLLLFSRHGGANIEETARSSPDLVKTQLLPPGGDVRTYQAIEWLSAWGFSGKLLLRLAVLVRKMALLFHRYDALLLEFNPLASTDWQDLVVLDCHMGIDDDALKRQSLDFEGLSSRMEGARQPTEFEQKAREIDQLDYRGVAGRMIEFDGNLGLLIGGGGASLTAFDAVRNSGGSPANYCEIGGKSDGQEGTGIDEAPGQPAGSGETGRDHERGQQHPVRFGGPGCDQGDGRGGQRPGADNCRVSSSGCRRRRVQEDTQALRRSLLRPGSVH